MVNMSSKDDGVYWLYLIGLNYFVFCKFNVGLNLYIWLG